MQILVWWLEVSLGCAALFAFAVFLDQVTTWWMVRGNTKENGTHLISPHVMDGPAARLEATRDMLAERRAEKARAGGQADSYVKPRQRSSRSRVLKLIAR